MMENRAVTPWGIATVGGPVILGAALDYGILRRRRRAASSARRSPDDDGDPGGRRDADAPPRR